MTTLIFSSGVFTQRKTKQSIKSHIKDHAKNVWISKYMEIAECIFQEAEKAFLEMEARN